jgi:hypothetical protein
MTSGSEPVSIIENASTANDMQVIPEGAGRCQEGFCALSFRFWFVSGHAKVRSVTWRGHGPWCGLFPGNPFENFMRALKADQQRIDQLESDIASVLVRVSALELARSHRLKDLVITPGDVDRLLRASHRIHELGNGVDVNNRVSDVAIEIARSRDGSLVVLPAVPA